MTGLGQQQVSGSELWDLFGLPAGGFTPAEMQAALCARQPFTASMGLLPRPTATGSSAGPDPTAAGASNSPETVLEGGGRFIATFTPAASPEFRPDEPAISIPIVPPPPSSDGGSSGGGGGGSGGSNGGSGQGLEARLWFVVLQTPAGPMGTTSMGSTCGSLASPASPGGISPMGLLRPSNMDAVQLGSLLGAGGFGRWGAGG